MTKSVHKSLDKPDETRLVPKGKVEVVNTETAVVGRVTFEPGWKWSESVKPIAGTETCQVAHTGYVISGCGHIVMDDGEEYDLEPGDGFYIAPGHDGWTVGDEAFVALDFTGMADYAKSS
ncbi:MAG TPA: cupin domain-containing protein [Acidimicrobiales bacterium]|nr:cupin domain-containing protein [Acidimicrobiales bacterium]